MTLLWWILFRRRSLQRQWWRLRLQPHWWKFWIFTYWFCPFYDFFRSVPNISGRRNLTEYHCRVRSSVDFSEVSSDERAIVINVVMKCIASSHRFISTFRTEGSGVKHNHFFSPTTNCATHRQNPSLKEPMDRKMGKHHPIWIAALSLSMPFSQRTRSFNELSALWTVCSILSMTHSHSRWDSFSENSFPLARSNESERNWAWAKTRTGLGQQTEVMSNPKRELVSDRQERSFAPKGKVESAVASQWEKGSTLEREWSPLDEEKVWRVLMNELLLRLEREFDERIQRRSTEADFWLQQT